MITRGILAMCATILLIIGSMVALALAPPRGAATLDVDGHALFSSRRRIRPLRARDYWNDKARWGSSSSASSAASSASSSSGNGGHTFTLFNNATEDIWVAILGNPGFQTIARGGFHMARAGPPVIVNVPVGWQGRVWARAGCKFDSRTGEFCDPPYQPCCASGSCLTADGRFGLHCAESGLAPTSLIEMSLDNNSPFGPYDVYDVSMVDGWSIPLSMTPINGTFNPSPDPGVTAPWCETSGCLGAPPCPIALQLNTTTLSCWSPCQAAVNNNYTRNFTIKECCVCTQTHPGCDCESTNDPWSSHYGCCSGGFGCTPYHSPAYPNDTVCDPWSADPERQWSAAGLAYIDVVRNACPRAYAWQFDDLAATFQCRKTYGIVDYHIAFTTRLR